MLDEIFCTPCTTANAKYFVPSDFSPYDVLTIREADGLLYKAHVIYPLSILNALRTLDGIDGLPADRVGVALAHSKELLLTRLQDHLIDVGKLLP